jgi:hypothetical protein
MLLLSSHDNPINSVCSGRVQFASEGNVMSYTTVSAPASNTQQGYKVHTSDSSYASNSVCAPNSHNNHPQCIRTQAPVSSNSKVQLQAQAQVQVQVYSESSPVIWKATK